MNFKLTTKTLAGIGTFGHLYYKGNCIAVSVECDWVNNEKNISCIPAGIYDLCWHSSTKFGLVLALHNPNLGVTVTGPSHRTHCYIHSANYASQLRGCIALGKTWNSQTWGVADSKDAVDSINALVKKYKVTQLEIVRL
ncbi:MAG: hypothetical protein COA84_14150 [Robiginitomaculum sp.]|nr:MAG: hypothetical protein COA84_14150 [Robiginitomaculum sp.]